MKIVRPLIISTALILGCLVLLSRTSVAQTSAVRARVTHAVEMENLVTLRGNVHPLVRPEYDQGVAPDDLPMERMLLVLQRGPDQEAALRQLLDDQQVKASPRFHQWLTPEQFGQQFGPADSDLQAVTDWLSAQGFEVTKVSAGRTVIEFSGTAGLVRQVLGTDMHRFRVDGEDHWANTRDPQIPAALAPVVAGFASLNNFPRKPLYKSLGTFSRSKLTAEIRPLFTLGSTYYLLGPSDFATIYNVAPLWKDGTDGSLQTIAVVGETNINIQDVRDFRSIFGLPANDPHIILNGPDPGITEYDETEADLDVEWSGAVAKGATIDLVVSESTETTAGTDLSSLFIIDNNLAPIMSESYGSCEQSLGTAGNAFYSTLWEQAAAQGITVVIAAGDTGSAGCDYLGESSNAAVSGLAVSGLASTPFNVAVGGTDFNDVGIQSTYWNPQTANNPATGASAKSYIPENTWNDTCARTGSVSACASVQSDGSDLDAGGGGPSSCINSSCTQAYSKPSWQTGTGVPNDHVRDIPDVSLLSGSNISESFYLVCQMDANTGSGSNSNSCDLNAPYADIQGAGGTSASVQAFAGIMALVNQAHGRQGNANYVLYPLAAQAGNTCVSNAAAVSNTSCIFYDTTTGNNSVACGGGSPNCSNTSSASGQYGIMVSGSPASAAYTTTTGYDMATGLGSVNVANLVNHWTSNFTPTTTTLTPVPSSTPVTLTYGQALNFTVSVAPKSGSGTPSGEVSLIAQTGSSSSNVTGIGPFTLSGGGVSGSTSMLPGGSYNVTAHYAGNGTFAASNSNTVAVQVGKGSSKTIITLLTFDLNGYPTTNNGTIAYGSPYILRMDVTNSSAQGCVSAATGLITYPCPTGNITLTPAPTNQDGTVTGRFTLNSQGYAEDQPIQLPTGVYPFVATYGGDNSYTGSPSPTLPVTVTKAVTTTSISGVPSSGVAGQQITVTATLTTESLGIAPAGTMQLLNNGSPLGSSVTVSGSGANSSAYAAAQAFLTATLPAGNLSITAHYSGDGNYAASTSPATTLTVSGFSLSANPSPVTISAGQTGNSTISVTPQGGFTGTVNLSVASGCPKTGATCTLSHSSVNVTNASAVTSTLTVTTTGAGSAPPATQRRVPPSFRLPVGLFGLLAGSLTLAMLLALSPMRRRPAALMFATTLLVAGVWVACGGGGGGGNLPPAPMPAVSLSPTSLTFSSQNVGTISAAQNVTLTNSGTAALSITSVGLSGTNPGDFAQTNTCASSVAAAANCTISVKFSPTAAGARSASVSIVDNASGSPHTLGLSGTGASVPTPTGTYPIVVNAVSGAISHSLTVNVKVQ